MYVLNALDGVLQDMNKRVWANIFFVCVGIFEIIPITDKCSSELYIILKYISSSIRCFYNNWGIVN